MVQNKFPLGGPMENLNETDNESQVDNETELIPQLFSDADVIEEGSVTYTVQKLTVCCLALPGP
jgi:hypothetical protein